MAEQSMIAKLVADKQGRDGEGLRPEELLARPVAKPEQARLPKSPLEPLSNRMTALSKNSG